MRLVCTIGGDCLGLGEFFYSEAVDALGFGVEDGDFEAVVVDDGAFFGDLAHDGEDVAAERQWV